MRKSTSRNLFLLAILLYIVAGVIFNLEVPRSSMPMYGGTFTLNNANNPQLVLLAGALAALGGILLLISWIGALIRTAVLGRWGWFVFLIIFSGITLLIYIFFGPNRPAYAPQYQPYQPPPYPRQ